MGVEFVAQQGVVCLPLSAQPFQRHQSNSLPTTRPGAAKLSVHAGARSAQKRAAVRHAGLPASSLTLRLVTVRLETGRLEVLATNLMNEALYPTAEFGELYHQPLGHLGLLRPGQGRLDLENFSGTSAKAVRQDVQATVFISNLESLLTRPAQEELRQPRSRAGIPAQVSRAVSFHALKSLSSNCC